MDWFIEEMKSPYSASILAGVLVFVFMYVDAKVGKREVSRASYIKNIAMTMFVVGLVVYCIGAYGDIPASNSGSTPPMTGGGGLGSVGGDAVNYNTADIRMNPPEW